MEIKPPEMAYNTLFPMREKTLSKNICFMVTMDLISFDDRSGGKENLKSHTITEILRITFSKNLE